MPRLIWVFAGSTCHFVEFVMLWLILCLHYDVINQEFFYSSSQGPQSAILAQGCRPIQQMQDLLLSQCTYFWLMTVSLIDSSRTNISSNLNICQSQIWPIQRISANTARTLPISIMLFSFLTLLLLNTARPVLANSVDPDQLASEEANWSGSALFIIKYVNLYQKPRSSNLIGWKLEVGVAS